MYERLWKSSLNIGLSGKFVLIFKENSKTIFSCVDVYLFNHVFTIFLYNLSPSFMQLKNSILSELFRFLDEKLHKVVFLCRPKS